MDWTPLAGSGVISLAQYGAKLAMGMDFSDAIISAKENTNGLSNAHTVKASAYDVPFLPESFDYIYCIGALHHMPDPEGAFREQLKYLKSDAPAFIWVYSKSRIRRERHASPYAGLIEFFT